MPKENKNIFSDNLQDLHFSKFTFNVEVTENIYLSQNKGSTFRGGFGNAFKNFVCYNPRENVCDNCIVKNDCSYFKIFGFKLDEQIVKKFGISGFAPRPYVIEPPNTFQQKFMKSERFSFNLILVGWSVSFLPYFIIIFENLGEKFGVGKRVNNSRGKFKLLNVINNGNEIYSGSTKKIKSNITKLTLKDIASKNNCNKLKISFISPTRIEVNKKRIRLEKPNNFKTFILRLYKRLFLQQEIYCNNKPRNYLIEEVGKQADEVILTNSKLNWNDLYRWKYSNTNNEKSNKKELMKMGGFIGEVTFEGNIAPFMDMIRLGEYLHVGKHYTFGLGKYEIIL